MSQQIDAIYDNGVFKPLVPLALPDQARVKLTVEEGLAAAPAAVPEPDAVDVEVLARQKAALEEMRRKIGQLPQHCNNDGWSVRQHDEILYGSHQ
jgi:predicted DNA-binding antitoxin AbrB/MazE fold protein